MKVQAYQKEYFEVELEETQMHKVWDSYPATSEQLLSKLESKFIQELEKKEKKYGLVYDLKEHVWLHSDLNIFADDHEYYRDATPNEIDFFNTITAMQNILLSRALIA